MVDTISTEITEASDASSVNTATESDDDQSIVIYTSIKHWNVYVKHGSTLNLNHQCGFNDFDPTNAVPIHITKLSNTKLGFESMRIVEKAIPPCIDPGSSTLNDLILIQPQWIRELLPLNEIHYPEQDYTPAEIMDIHGDKDSPTEGLLVVSDGSVKVNNMAHGWVIANNDGKIIVCGAGAAQGKGSSLRAEGYGMLAATLFMTLVGEYTNTKDICIHRISDNEELINRCKAHQNYIDTYPNAAVKGEYDITEQIDWTTRKHAIRGSYYWVKGHQDDNASAELSIEALLNIEADRLAGDFQDQKGSNRPIVTMMPCCPAMLDIKGVSITSRLFHQLVREHTKETLLQQIQTKEKWDNVTAASIEWKSLSIAITRIDRNVVITKVCNGILPTMKVLHKTKQSFSKKCPLCPQIESQEHMLLCNDASRLNLRRTLVKNIWIEAKKIQTCDTLTDHLCSVITEWLDTGVVQVQRYPKPIRATLLSQTDIGWYNMFRGRLSNQWLQQYESTKSRSSKEGTRPCEPVVWGAKIIELLLRFHIKVWEQRNKEVHGNDKHKVTDNFKRRQLQSEIRKLQRFKHKARPDDEFLFVHLKTFLKSDTDTLITYFKSHKKAIANSVEQQKKVRGTTKRTQSIAGWLRNTAVVHRTIRRSHTRRRKREERKQTQTQMDTKKRKVRETKDAAVMQRYMTPRPTFIEKVNKKFRKMKDTIERRRMTRRRRKQSEEIT